MAGTHERPQVECVARLRCRGDARILPRGDQCEQVRSGRRHRAGVSARQRADTWLGIRSRRAAGAEVDSKVDDRLGEPVHQPVSKRTRDSVPAGRFQRQTHTDQNRQRQRLVGRLGRPDKRGHAAGPAALADHGPGLVSGTGTFLNRPVDEQIRRNHPASHPANPASPIQQRDLLAMPIQASGRARKIIVARPLAMPSQASGRARKIIVARPLAGGPRRARRGGVHPDAGKRRASTVDHDGDLGQSGHHQRKRRVETGQQGAGQRHRARVTQR